MRIGEVLDGHFHALFGHDHGTDLKKSQPRPRRFISTLPGWSLQIQSRRWRPVASSAALSSVLISSVERKLLPHQQRSEVEDTGTIRAQAGNNAIARRVKGRRQKAQHAISLGIFQTSFHQVLGLADRIVRGRLAHVDGPEVRLRAAQHFRHRTKRWRLFRVGGRECPGYSAVHNRLAQTERQARHTFLRTSRSRPDRSCRSAPRRRYQDKSDHRAALPQLPGE